MPRDRDLWRRAVDDVKPLRDRAKPELAPSRPVSPPKPAPSASRARPAPPPEPSRAAPALGPGAAVDVDAATVERLRRGRLPIAGRIDLHGMTQAEAHAALARFLGDGVAAGRRCVLVITGRGGWDAGGDGGRPGVLRRMVPRWLNEPGNRPRILAFAEAQPRHGGAGALYVLLRRSRSARSSES
ncbi:MAG: Smr/MutS family protein [Alphaproteobacteria bacterium]|nr:Smr/MutS family protein [Alphaproteobacteria bacterium]